jgi:hypothetical protein
MTYLKPKQPTQALSYEDRETIAYVLNYDNSGTYRYHPDEIAAFYIDEDGDQVQICFVDGRNRPINRSFFRSVLEIRKANTQKHIDAIIEAEARAVDGDRYPLETEAFIDAHLDMNKDRWLTEPVGISICANPDVVFGVAGGDRL